MTILEKRILQRVKSVTKLDPLKKTRKMEYVEARALLIHLLYNECNLGYTQICKFFKENGKYIHHATVMHSLKNFEMYIRYSKTLKLYHTEILAIGSRGSVPAKIDYVKQRLEEVNPFLIEEIYNLISSELRNENRN